MCVVVRIAAQEYAMLRVLALLLMLPPTLLPPGMCVCQFVPLGKASAARQSPSHARGVSAAHAATPRPDCSCDSCRSPSTERGAADDRPPPFSVESPADPGPGKHWPGCPAAVGAAPLDVVVTAVTAPADLVVLVDLFWPAPGAAVSRTPVPMVTLRAIPPLYISHCALLI